MQGEFSHVPVLLRECIEGLAIRPDGIYVDGTLGRAGHSLEIARRLTTGRLICIDQDEAAIEAAKVRLAEYMDRITLVRSNFNAVGEILRELGIAGADGMLFDLGVSSPQLDDAERGFSYMHDAPLDMRMDRRAALTAHDIVNTWSAEELKRILYEYGEERYAGAIRIAVNDELGVLEPMLRGAVKGLNPGGRLCVITFHSLEDRIVKKTMQALARGCTCPPDFPVCVCGNKPKVRIVSRKPILPGQDEIMDNPRARSAKLRIAERTEFEWKED